MSDDDETPDPMGYDEGPDELDDEGLDDEAPDEIPMLPEPPPSVASSSDDDLAAQVIQLRQEAQKQEADIDGLRRTQDWILQKLAGMGYNKAKWLWQSWPRDMSLLDTKKGA